jgi:hypothetical protein
MALDTCTVAIEIGALFASLLKPPEIGLFGLSLCSWAIIGGGMIFPRSPRTTRNKKKHLS